MALSVWGACGDESDEVCRNLMTGDRPITIGNHTFKNGEHAIAFMRVTRCSANHRDMSVDTLLKEGAKNINRLAYNLSTDNNISKYQLNDTQWVDEAERCLRKVVQELIKEDDVKRALIATGSSEIVFTCKTSRNKEGFLTGVVVGDGTKYTGENYIGKTLVQQRNTLHPASPNHLEVLLQGANIDMGISDKEMDNVETRHVPASAEIDIDEDGLPREPPSETTQEPVETIVAVPSMPIRADLKRKTVSFDIDISKKNMAFDFDFQATTPSVKSIRFYVSL